MRTGRIPRFVAALLLLGGGAGLVAASSALVGDPWARWQVVAADLVLAALLVAGRPRRLVGLLPWATWLVALGLVGAGQLVFALPHALAGIALMARSDPDPTPAPASPDAPHRFSRPEVAWYAELLPLSWSGGPLGAFQRGAATCRWCGEVRGDPRHTG